MFDSYRNVLVYSFLLLPLSPNLFGTGVSANYSYVFLLFFLKLTKNNFATSLILYSIISFLIGVLLLSDYNEIFIFRQLISFVLFVSTISILYLRLPGSLDDLLKAIVLNSTIYSLYVLFCIAFSEFSLNDMYSLKGELREYVTDWPQRYVIVLMMGFFIALHFTSRNKIWFLVSLIILSCIFLTFTRAAWLGILVSYCVGCVFYTQKFIWYSVVGIFVLLFLNLFDIGSLQIDQTIKLLLNVIEIFLSLGAAEPVGSTAERLHLWDQMLYVLNPLTGSGFAGVYLYIEGEGSAHSQYLDILFRTGLVGLGFYVWLWVGLLGFYRKHNCFVFLGLVAIFVFGFFQETTKLTYGSFIIFALFNKIYEYKRYNVI